ncbi:DNA polymerase delta small subunit-like [Salvia splendens]|uniref:DNA polymerase delta small subunit-like n=1 Tax=Salvia splendens TaxID=180675 RepID=UPI001C26EA39|nr:DNA polymerase delta small subunit-like [Salvia splendens]
MEVNSENGLLQGKQATTYKLPEVTFLIVNETYIGQQHSRIYVARLGLMRTMVYSPGNPICQEQGMAPHIVRVVIAGNSVEFARGILNGQNLGSRDQSKLSEHVKELDILMSQIAAGIPVDIMPGEADPANSALPQLLYVWFLGTSGQNIDDLAKYSNATSKLKFLERTLGWRHIAPTAPNTLGSNGQALNLRNLECLALTIGFQFDS